MNDEELKKEFGEDVIKKDDNITPKKKDSFWKSLFFPILVIVLAIVALIYFGAIPSIIHKVNETQNNTQNISLYTQETCKCGPCNMTISLSNLSKEGYKDLKCCVHATWNTTTNQCDFKYQTTKIVLPKPTVVNSTTNAS